MGSILPRTGGGVTHLCTLTPEQHPASLKEPNCLETGSCSNVVWELFLAALMANRSNGVK